ncbi:HCO3 transporter family-domain-containing protein, partial [Baffinella frigidus]
ATKGLASESPPPHPPHLKEAIKGLASEFSPPHPHFLASASARRAEVGVGYGVAEEQPWLLFNGSFALVLAGGLLYTSIRSVEARNWVIFPGFLRRFIADYGTAVFVLIWTLLSYIPAVTGPVAQQLPETIPRRLVIPNTFDGSKNYFVLQRLGELEGWHRLGELEGWHVGAAIIPAAIIAVLFFFDHNVSSQLAQEGMHLRKPAAYHWDFFLLSMMTLLCGCIGIPPVNGVIPQAPMHSRANAIWLKKKELKPGEEDDADEHEGRPYYILENRVSNLLQSLLCGVALLATPILQKALLATPILQKIPRSVLWGFFAFMAIEGLPGNQ